LLIRPFRISAEKEQLITAHREVKEQAMQAELRHARELKEAKAAAEAKLDESLKEYTNSTAVLRAEMEEETVARKAAQDRLALLEAEQKEYDRLVLQTDALALRKFLCSFLFFAYKLIPFGIMFLSFFLSHGSFRTPRRMLSTRWRNTGWSKKWPTRMRPGTLMTT
jgi:hypothetical protein